MADQLPTDQLPEDLPLTEQQPLQSPDALDLVRQRYVARLGDPKVAFGGEAHYLAMVAHFFARVGQR